MTGEQVPDGGGGPRIIIDGARPTSSLRGIVPCLMCHGAAAALTLALVGSAAATTFAGEAPAARRMVYLYRDALWSADPDGRQARPLTKGLSVYAYDVTPDGSRVAFAAGAWQGDRRRRDLTESAVWIANADGTGARRVAGPLAVQGSEARVGRLRWSPDGTVLAYDVVAGKPAGAGGMLFVVHPAHGKASAVVPTPVAGFEWTPDGRIKYRLAAPGGEAAEWIVSPDGSRPARLPDARHTAVKDADVAEPFVRSSAPPLPPEAVPQSQPPPPPAPAISRTSPPAGAEPMAGAD